MVDEAGKLLARYRLDAKIATGGMGALFEATDERLDRKVAVKLLKDELAQDPTFVERFRREARSVAALSHPNIATVFDYGEDDNGHFIVMEYVRGRDLARVLREEGPLEEERAAFIAAQVCDALSRAHESGVVHRDIKPANIMVGEDDQVKVTDFGIARAAGAATLTATGSVLGTVQYISPEQASGKDVGPASDLYSLGIVLYEMLTGSLPFAGDAPIAVAMRHVSDEVPAPSSRNPRVSPHMDRIVARATAKAPADRFPGADDMAAALRETYAAASNPTNQGLVGTVVPAAGVDEGATRILPPDVWPARSRWDARKLTRWVAMAFAVLALVALLLLVARLNGEDRSSGAQRPASPPPTQRAAPPGVVIPSGIVGMNHEQAKELLGRLGLHAEDVRVAADAPRDSVISSEPPPGSEVQRGETVTLRVSEGPPEIEEEKEEKAEDDGNRGKGKGKENQD